MRRGDVPGKGDAVSSDNCGAANGEAGRCVKMGKGRTKGEEKKTCEDYTSTI